MTKREIEELKKELRIYSKESFKIEPNALKQFLKNGLYLKHFLFPKQNCVEYVPFEKIRVDIPKKRIVFKFSEDALELFSFHQYGKDWALSEEELK